MQSENRLFDDVARLAGGALNMLTGLKSEIEALVRQQMEGWLTGMHLVTRDEFETVRQMVAKARDEQEDLLLRIATLEKILASSGKNPSTLAKTAGKAKSKSSDADTSL